MSEQSMQESRLGFSDEWEQRYSESTHLSIWPWSDLVSYVNRYAKPKDDFNTVLELGCGAGANIPLFLGRNDNYFAIEGSQSIVDKLIQKFPRYADNIVCGDFTKEIPFPLMFDVIVDRASLTHNRNQSIAMCLKLLSGKTRVGGIFIGIDWFSERHSDSKKGVPVDSHTRRSIESKTFGGVGNVHFSDKSHLVDMFGAAGFEITMLEHKTTEMLIGDNDTTQGSFNFVAVKTGATGQRL